MNAVLLALVGAAAASSVGGALPPGLSSPSISGFDAPTVSPSRGGLAVCTSGFVNVSVAAVNNRYAFRVPLNQTQATETFLELVTSGSPFSSAIANGSHAVNGTYRIGATLCTPANEIKPSQVQLLTHGIGFDRTYWDFAPGYSYVDVAAQHGHATFFYDRLSVGLSSQPSDGVNVVQSFTELEILANLATKLRRGYFSNTTFPSVVGVGHSYGSILSQGVTSKYPSAFDAAILTGFSGNSSADPAFFVSQNFALAALDQPLRYSGLNYSYLASSTPTSVQYGFFRAPNFDPAVLALAYATQGTVTFGELFSLSAVVKPAANWTKPVAVVNGDNDLPFCYGNCSYPTNLAAAVLPKLYPRANHTGTFLVPTTGHGINLHYSAVSAFEYIQNFLKAAKL